MSTTQYTQPDDINDITASVRRHHTISAVNRPHRTHSRTSISEIENEEDEIVGDDWSGGVGAVGEGKGLHRQSSLPSRHSSHRGHQHGGSSGSATPSRQAVNSLSVIAAEHGPDGEDGEDEWWERQMRGLRGDDQFSRNESIAAPAFASMAHGTSPMHTASAHQISHESVLNHARSFSQSSHSSSIASMEPSSPPPPMPNDLSGTGGVRRHQSLTYGHQSARETGARSLMRSATHGKTKYSSRAPTMDQGAPDVPPVPDQYFQASVPAEGLDASHVSPGSGGSPGSVGLGNQWGPQSSSSSPSAGQGGAWGPPQQQDDLAESFAGLEVGSNNTGSSGQMRNAVTNQYGNYYPTGLYGPNATLNQPQPNANHMRKLTPPPTQAPRFRSPSPRYNQQQQDQQMYATGGTSPGMSSGVFNPSGQGNSSTARSPIHKLSLVTNINQGQGGQQDQGPVSAAAYVPPTGGGLPLGESLGGHSSQDQNGDPNATPIGPGGGREKSLTATGISWDEKHRIAGMRGDHNGSQPGGAGPHQAANAANFFLNPALFSTFDPSLQQQLIQHFQNQGLATPGVGGPPLQQPNIQQQIGGAQMPNNHQMMQLMQQQQILQQQMIQQQQLYQPPPHGQYAMPRHHGVPSRLNTQLATNQLRGDSGHSTPGNGENADGSLISPVDLPTLIANKGYNPLTFDTTPQFARFFVIKSYTEDDVHKSIKYEIWSSTDPGNKRLDKAFKETNGRGPIYLFFSVNASGHFCGMAEMLTPVDYTRSSTVWAQDKWKGVFKVKWIFIKDIPNGILRHIRLTNTQEQKAVTNSRDTQELLPDAGHEMLRICLTHTSRTSLLQDFLYYEVQSLQKTLQPGTPGQPATSPQPQQQQFQPSPGMPSPGQFTQYPNQIQSQSYGVYPIMQHQGRQQGIVSPPPRMPSAQSFTTGPSPN